MMKRMRAEYKKEDKRDGHSDKEGEKQFEEKIK